MELNDDEEEFLAEAGTSLPINVVNDPYLSFTAIFDEQLINNISVLTTTFYNIQMTMIWILQE